MFLKNDADKLLKIQRYTAIILLFFGFGISQLNADEISDKRELTIADFDMWNSINDQVLSDDGAWLAYYLKPQLGDGELVIKGTEDKTVYRLPRGTEPGFGYNDKTVIYTIVPPEDEFGNPEKDVKKKLGIFNIAGQDTTIYDRLNRYLLSENKTWLAIIISDTTEMKEESDTINAGNENLENRENGSTLILKNLKTNEEIRFENVKEFSFDKNERYLIYVISSDDESVNGIYSRELANDASDKIVTGIGSYKDITWDEPGDQIAFLVNRDTSETKNKPWKIYTWEAGEEKAQLLMDPGITEGFPETMKIANNPELMWSKSTNSLFFKIQETEDEEENDTSVSPEEIPDVNIWHWQDVLIHPQRETRKDELANIGYLSIFHLQENKFIQLANDTIATISFSPDHTRAIGIDRNRYELKQPWNPEFHDVYLVDLDYGSHNMIRERQRFGMRWSNGSGFLFWFEDRDWYSFDIQTRKTHTLSKNIPTELRNLVFDRAGVPGAWGSPGWIEDDAGVLIYDRYDIWLVSPDGTTASNITGQKNKDGNATFRYVRLDREEEFIHFEDPVLFSYFDNATKASGYYRYYHSSNRLDRLIKKDKSIAAPTVTEDNSTFIFTMETFDIFPDLYISDTDFQDIQQMTDVNPQQVEFAWGSAELFEWKNSDGVPLQGILYLPANYEAGNQYPLIVYIYERLSDLLHRYSVPRATSRINPAFYTSNGYAVLDADVVYTLGQPGQSAVKSVVPAALKLVEMGIADPDKIGLQGHSWGGYQAAYAITRTNLFSAAVAGTPVSNMISAYGGIRWGTGNPRTYQYEIGQSRIGYSLWERLDLYIENSPVFYTDRIETPLLVMHGDDDGAVPWYQSIELYLAMRRLGKEMFFLHYSDAPHNLRKRKNRIDYNHRIFDFFEHYLLGREAPEWITTRVSDRTP